jgi:hypothetical protein
MLSFRAPLKIEQKEGHGPAYLEECNRFCLLIIQILWEWQARKLSSRNVAGKWGVFVEVWLGRHFERFKVIFSKLTKSRKDIVENAMMAPTILIYIYVQFQRWSSEADDKEWEEGLRCQPPTI